jgi:hypothetical protein
LLARKGLEPFVSEDGHVFTVSYTGAGDLQLVLDEASHIAALINLLQDEAKDGNEVGQRVLADAYRLFRGMQDLREDMEAS